MSELKGLPKSEKAWERISDGQGRLKYVVTSDMRREWYYLYRATNGGFEKVGRAKNPRDLLRRYG